RGMPPRERTTQYLGELRDGQKDLHRITMHEHESRIRVDGADGIEGEQVLGTFHNPPPAAFLMLQVLKKTLVEQIGRQIASLIQPAAVGRYPIRRIEAQAAEHMRGDLAALLR